VATVQLGFSTRPPDRLTRGHPADAFDRLYTWDKRDRTMEIGKPRRTVTVEPVEDPVPRELPEELPEKEPAEAPRQPEKIPA
jgi:hypothetical protein